MKWFKNWLRKLVGYFELEEEHKKTLKEFRDYAAKTKAVDLNFEPSKDRYFLIPVFDKSNIEFIKAIAELNDKPELKFLLHDLRQQVVENMVVGNVEANLQSVGILKGIDNVIKNLEGYAAMWEKVKNNA